MKWYGNIGFATSVEKVVNGQPTSVWENRITVKQYYGELSKPVNKWNTGSGENDDKSFSSQLSIVSDPFANENFHSIKYAEVNGVKWKVEAIEIIRPRLLLTLGGEYVNG